MLTYFRRKNGQVTIEFATMIIGVLAALFIMQRYILRGVSGRWKMSGDMMGQGKIYDEVDSKECRFATFFRGSPGRWFDQKCFESSCGPRCLGPASTASACNGCLAGCGGGC